MTIVLLHSVHKTLCRALFRFKSTRFFHIDFGAHVRCFCQQHFLVCFFFFLQMVNFTIDSTIGTARRSQNKTFEIRDAMWHDLAGQSTVAVNNIKTTTLTIHPSLTYSSSGKFIRFTFQPKNKTFTNFFLVGSIHIIWRHTMLTTL